MEHLNFSGLEPKSSVVSRVLSRCKQLLQRPKELGQAAQLNSEAAAISARSSVVFDELPVRDSIRGIAFGGVLILVVYFFGFGTWAVTAPLNGAVVSTGFVKVDGNRKSVQHLDGGIVKEMRVKEGDHVKAGDVLIVLDDSQARAEFQVLSEQNVVLRATEERLRAEFMHKTELVMPRDLMVSDSEVETIWRGQVYQFESRRAALNGQRNVINEKIAQLESQVVGGEAQVKSFQAQLDSVVKEMASIAPLVDKGLVARPRYLQLERAAAGLEGQAADGQASIAKARQAIAEQMQQIAQLDNDRIADVTKDLRDTQAKLLEV